ncbi:MULTISPECIES: hypothetical protein [Sphingomonas]|uniref:hypothetical protein n=1 Tax=Sphingomonas TaxID=13687 RepID=UPI0008353AD9|nr:hypothetical protein [Sphingomonas sp. CCH10-B3]
MAGPPRDDARRLYVQVAQTLARQIADGDDPIGARVPFAEADTTDFRPVEILEARLLIESEAVEQAIEQARATDAATRQRYGSAV